MPQVDRLEASEVAALVERALAAPSFEAALPRWRTVFVERLDFRSATSTLRLTSPALPAPATRVAERDGVQVVALALPDDRRVTAVEIRAALKDVRASLNSAPSPGLFPSASSLPPWSAGWTRLQLRSRRQPTRVMAAHEVMRQDSAARLGRSRRPADDTRLRRYLARELRALRNLERDEDELRRIGVLNRFSSTTCPAMSLPNWRTRAASRSAAMT